MPFWNLLLLGAIAGYTIFLGLPFARLRKVSEEWRIGAGAASAGASGNKIVIMPGTG